MPAELTLRSRGAAAPGPTAIAAGGSVPVGVAAGLLSWHAVFTGGPLPGGTSWLSRLMFRASTEDTLWACIEPVAGEWRATQLYHRIEITEKAQASYRLGTIFAGAASDLCLGIPLLVHRETLFGKSAGERGDLLGLRPATGDWHGVEAKGKSPEWASGERRYVAPGEFKRAKKQAQSLGGDLVAAGAPTGTGDHWAITSRASTGEQLEIVLDDPDADKPDEPRRPIGPDFPQDDPFERLLQGYYQVVADIDALIELGPSDGAHPRATSDEYRGAVIPGTTLWIGAKRQLFGALRNQRLREVLPQVAEDERNADDSRYAAMGLLLERLAPTQPGQHPNPPH